MAALPRVEELTPSEKKSRVQILPGDRSHYPEFYYWSFDKILKYTNMFPVPPTEESIKKLGASNWDGRYKGYSDWAAPYQEDDVMAGESEVSSEMGVPLRR